MENQDSSYRTVYQEGTGEILEKKSRFIAHVYPVESEEAAIGIIEMIKKQYWDARHNCYAYIIGKNQETVRCSDDGEPQGTAGRPMLEVLQREELRNVLVVVTRYFGGVLLGTGGLVRAYTQALQEGLKNAGTARMQNMAILSLQTDYNNIGKVKYFIANEQIDVQKEEYTQDVVLQIAVSVEQKTYVCKQLTELTNGRIKVEEKETMFLLKQIDK